MAMRRRLTRRKFAVGLASIGPIASVAARIGSAAAASKTKLTMWLDTTGSANEAKCMEQHLIDPYNAQSKTIEVDATPQANNWQKTLTAVSGGGGPDVVGTPGPSFAVDMANAKQLAPLDDFIKQYGWDKRFVPWTLDLGKVNGHIYSLPDEAETMVLYYNKTLFSKHDWQPPKTMDELMTLAATIKKADIIPFAHGNADWRPANEWFETAMLNHVAGPDKVYQALTGKISWTDPAFIKAMDLLAQMQKNGWFMGGLDRYYTGTNADRYSAFGNGDAAMDIEGTWAVFDFTDYFGDAAGNDNEWAWVPIPNSSGSTPVFAVGIGSTNSINAHSKDPKTVADFLNYFYQPETMARLANECALMPAPVNVNPDSLTKVDPRLVQIIKAYYESLNSGSYGYTTWTFWPPKTETYMIETVEKVWAGDMTTADFMAGVDKLFKQELAAGTVPPIPARK